MSDVDSDFYVRDSALRHEGGEYQSNAARKAQKWKDEAYEKLESADNKKGFNESRGCVDCFCLLIFLAFVGAMGYLTYYAYTTGDVNKLTAPLDADLNFCGVDDYVDYPYMYLTDFNDLDIEKIFTSGICVKACPPTTEEPLDCKPNNVLTTCDVPADKHYASSAYVEYCLPSNYDEAPETFKTAYEMAKQQMASSEMGSFFVDSMSCKKTIMFSMLTGIILCMLYTALMSYASEVLAKICIFLTWVGLVGLAVVLWLLRSQKLDIRAQQMSLNATAADVEALDLEISRLMWGIIGAGVLAFLYTCCVYCYWESLQTAIDVIDASADFLADTYRIVFTVMFHFILQIIVVFIWCGAMACVISLNQITPSSTIPQMKNIEWDDNVWYMCLFMFFGLLWITALVDYTSNFIVITSASTYYFNNERAITETQNPADVCKAWKIAYLNHMGSIAIGSFIIAVIRFIKYTFVYLTQKIEGWTEGSQVKVLLCFLKCATCCLECIERVTDYINESAFCYIAVTGDNFCTGALMAMYIKLRFLAETAFATFLAKMFIFIGKIAIIVGNVFLFKLMLEKATMEIDNITNPTGPMIVVAIITYLFVSMFIGMFDESVNAMLTCVAIDTNVNGTPIYGPETFNNRLNTDESGSLKIKKSDKRRLTPAEERMLGNNMA